MTALMCGRASAQALPTTTVNALDGHAVKLPGDLQAQATVIIVGFSRKASEPTMVWERAVRGPLDGPPAASTYVAAMLAEVPGFARGFVVRSIRKQVPVKLHGNFLALTAREAEWKTAAGFVAGAPDAAYVLLVDKSGTVVWKTHETFSGDALERLRSEMRRVETHPGR